MAIINVDRVGSDTVIDFEDEPGVTVPDPDGAVYERASGLKSQTDDFLSRNAILPRAASPAAMRSEMGGDRRLASAAPAAPAAPAQPRLAPSGRTVSETGYTPESVEAATTSVEQLKADVDARAEKEKQALDERHAAQSALATKRYQQSVVKQSAEQDALRKAEADKAAAVEEKRAALQVEADPQRLWGNKWFAISAGIGGIANTLLDLKRPGKSSRAAEFWRSIDLALDRDIENQIRTKQGFVNAAAEKLALADDESKRLIGKINGYENIIREAQGTMEGLPLAQQQELQNFWAGVQSKKDALDAALVDKLLVKRSTSTDYAPPAGDKPKSLEQMKAEDFAAWKAKNPNGTFNEWEKSGEGGVGKLSQQEEKLAVTAQNRANIARRRVEILRDPKTRAEIRAAISADLGTGDWTQEAKNGSKLLASLRTENYNDGGAEPNSQEAQAEKRNRGLPQPGGMFADEDENIEAAIAASELEAAQAQAEAESYRSGKRGATQARPAAVDPDVQKVKDALGFKPRSK